jgi:hypothetical protein
MTTQHPGRHGTAYWNARKKVLAGATHCALCGGDLDFNAPPRSKYAPCVDHIIPLSELEHYDPAERLRLSVDPSNMRPAHITCNSKRGAHSGGRAWVVPAPAYADTPERSPDAWRSPDSGRWWSRDWGGGVRNRDWAAHVAAGGMNEAVTDTDAPE